MSYKMKMNKQDVLLSLMRNDDPTYKNVDSTTLEKQKLYHFIIQEKQTLITNMKNITLLPESPTYGQQQSPIRS